MLISAGRLLTPQGDLTPGWVRVSGRTIEAVGLGEPPEIADHAVDLLAPGFVDAHCHGGGGASFTGDEDEVALAASTHLLHGTTTVVASLVSEPVSTLERQLHGLRDLISDGILGGVHLEGPWLSPVHAGAHEPGVLVAPTSSDVDRLMAAGGAALRMVTLAPELPGAVHAIRALTSAGTTVAVGHTDADGATTRSAFDAGARVVTHLFNAMRPLHHRSPGPAGVALSDPRVAVELIVDGVHLSPEVAALAARSAVGGFLLVTDAMAAAGADDGPYRLGSLDVTVLDSVARLASSGAIAGSTLTMDAAVRGAVAAGVRLSDALQAATLTPTERLGFDDRGALAPGNLADLVVLDDDLAVTAVMRTGAWVAR